jgi:hypothetical protein
LRVVEVQRAVLHPAKGRRGLGDARLFPEFHRVDNLHGLPTSWDTGNVQQVPEPQTELCPHLSSLRTHCGLMAVRWFGVHWWPNQRADSRLHFRPGRRKLRKAHPCLDNRSLASDNTTPLTSKTAWDAADKEGDGMPVRAHCPHCIAPCLVAERHIGVPVKCHKCGKAFTVHPTALHSKPPTTEPIPPTAGALRLEIAGVTSVGRERSLMFERALSSTPRCCTRRFSFGDTIYWAERFIEAGAVEVPA